MYVCMYIVPGGYILPGGYIYICIYRTWRRADGGHARGRRPAGFACSIRQHTSAYVSIRQHEHTSAYVSTRQHTLPVFSLYQYAAPLAGSMAFCHADAAGGGGGIPPPGLATAAEARKSSTCTYVSIRQHVSAYVSICQYTSAYVSIRQHTSAYVSIREPAPQRCFSRCCLPPLPYSWRATLKAAALRGRRQLSLLPFSIRQHTSAYVNGSSARCTPVELAAVEREVYVSIRQHTSTSAYVSTRQHTSAYVSIRHASIRQHTSASISIRQHQSAYVSIRQHTSAYVSIRLHT